MQVDDEKLDASIAREPAPSPLLSAVDAWFAKHFSNSIVSRDTEIFNHVHAAKEDLKRLLSQGDH